MGLKNRHRNPRAVRNISGYTSTGSTGIVVDIGLDTYPVTAPVGDPTNRHPNPDVETDSTGWTDDTTSGTVLNTALVRSAVWAYSGTRSMLLGRSNANDGVTRAWRMRTSPAGTAGIAVSPGDMVRMRARLNVVTSDATTNVRVTAAFYDAAGAVVEDEIQSGPAAATGATGEMTCEGRFVAPDGAAFTRATVNATGANQWTVLAYVDAMEVTVNELLSGTVIPDVPDGFPEVGENFVYTKLSNPDATVREGRVFLSPEGSTDSYVVSVTPDETIGIRVQTYLFDDGPEGHEAAIEWYTDAGAAFDRPTRSGTYRVTDDHVTEMKALVPTGAAYGKAVLQTKDAAGSWAFEPALSAVRIYTPQANTDVPYDPDYTLQLIGDQHWTTNPQIGKNLNSGKMIADIRLNGLPCLARIDVGDTVDNGLPAQDAYAAERYASMNDDVPMYHAMGNHDVQNSVRTAQQWAQAWGYPEPSYVVNLRDDLRIIMLSQSGGFTRTLNAADLALLSTWLSDDDRPTWIVNHYPMQNTLLGDFDRHFLTAVSDYIQPIATYRAILDANPHVVGHICGHVHPAIDEQDDWIKNENVGSREIVHIVCPAPGYTAYGIAAQLSCYSLFLELLPDEEPRIHIRDHNLHAFVDLSQPKTLKTAPYVVSQPAYEPEAFFDGNDYAWQWDTTENLSASREEAPAEPQAFYQDDEDTEVLGLMLDTLTHA